MTDMAENTNTANAPQQSRRISTIFGCYRNNFALFWRVSVARFSDYGDDFYDPRYRIAALFFDGS